MEHGKDGNEFLAPLDEDMVEVSLLLPNWYANALEAAAHARGQTAAHLVRRLIRDFLAERT